MSTDSDCVDPRVQVELERLNTATDDINSLEGELDEARTAFRRLLVESAEKVRSMASRLGASVQAAKPYYEARLRASQAAHQTRSAMLSYDKADSSHCAAREMVFLAEQGLGGGVGVTLDPAWQEMLNHATSRVNQAEVERGIAKVELNSAKTEQERFCKEVSRLQQELKSAIKASSLSFRRNLLMINVAAFKHQVLFLPYYETRAQYNTLLQCQKTRVQTLENQVNTAKLDYSQALKNLECISDEIHQHRKNKTKCKQNLNPDVDLNDMYDIDFLEEEYLSLPENLGIGVNKILEKGSVKTCQSLLEDESLDSNCGSWNRNNLKFVNNCQSDEKTIQNGPDRVNITSNIEDDSETWTEINLTKSSSDDIYKYNYKDSGCSNRNGDVPYERLGDSNWPMSDSSDSLSMENFELASSNSASPAGSSSNKEFVDKDKKNKEVTKCRPTSSDNHTNASPRKLSYVTRSNASAVVSQNQGRRQSFDVLLGDTGDRVKEMLSQGIQIIGSLKLTERRGSDATSEVNNFTENGSSMENARSAMLTDEQVKNLRLEEDFTNVCSQLLSSSDKQ